MGCSLHASLTQSCPAFSAAPCVSSPHRRREKTGLGNLPCGREACMCGQPGGLQTGKPRAQLPVLGTPAALQALP